MILQAPLAHATTIRATASIAADALTRIPAAHFRDMPWAQDAVATCLTLIESATCGDSERVDGWISDVVRIPQSASLLCVLTAVCDAIVADAFRTKGDARNVMNFVSGFEHDVLAQLAARRQHEDVDAMNDSDTAQLADGLVRVVQMHDNDTATHLDATGALARRIAIAMQLPAHQTAAIELAGRLHDIGKVGVRKDILSRSGPLCADAAAEMRLHAEAGAMVLRETPSLAHLAPIVRAHHERMDGSGYPDQLRADEIPLESRVIAVADAFHAMTSERSYRPAMMPNDALAIIAENAGPQFDTDVVETTFELFRYVRRAARRAVA